ncbi:MAG: FkbM family methyltransferase [Planctomycetota bacterium]
MLSEWIKHRVIGSPLQRPAEIVRQWATIPKRFKHPELTDILLEAPRSRQVIAKAVTDGMNCVDVGCHLGSVLSEMLRHSPSGVHTAIEPLPYKADWLRSRYPQTNVVEAAVAETAGQVEFTWNKSRPGFSSLAAESPNGDLVERVTVQTQPLDEIVPADRSIGFMKVDVEGAELLALRSGRRIMTQDRPTVMFECARRSTNALGFEVDQVYDLLTNDYDYLVMYLHEYLSNRQPLDLESFKKSMFYPFKAFNFVAVPR